MSSERQPREGSRKRSRERSRDPSREQRPKAQPASPPREFTENRATSPSVAQASLSRLSPSSLLRDLPSRSRCLPEDRATSTPDTQSRQSSRVGMRRSRVLLPGSAGKFAILPWNRQPNPKQQHNRPRPGKGLHANLKLREMGQPHTLVSIQPPPSPRTLTMWSFENYTPFTSPSPSPPPSDSPTSNLRGGTQERRTVYMNYQILAQHVP